jgi:uncharacterized iron-regulated membrane protein
VRRALFQVHLWCGVGLSLYILAICVSGSAVVFRRELDRVLCPATLTVPVGTHRLTTAELASKAHAVYPRFDPGHIDVHGAKAPNAPAEIVLSGGGPDSTAFSTLIREPILPTRWPASRPWSLRSRQSTTI